MKQINLAADEEDHKVGWLYVGSTFIAFLSIIAVSVVGDWVISGVEDGGISPSSLLNLSRKFDLVLWIMVYALADSAGRINRTLWRLSTLPQLCGFIGIASNIVLLATR